MKSIVLDILQKLKETKQTYIVDHDMPVSISKRIGETLV